MKHEEAETVALRALSWLVANDDLRPVFLGASGASPEALKSGAQSPEFLISILDFLTMDDAWVIAFCDSEQLSYEIPLRARQALPGGADVSWT